MMTCQRCSEQLLEYVYGLLDVNDPADAVIVTDIRAHLTTCASCQAALKKVEAQQQLLAEASRISTSLVFTAPKMEVRKSFSRQRSTATTWYVSAATLVIALLGMMGTTYWWGTTTKWQPAEQARAELEQLRHVPLYDSTQLTSLQQKITEGQATTAKLTQTIKELEASKQRELLANTTYQQLFAPMTAQVSNDTPLVMTNKTLNGAPAPLNDVAINFLDAGSKQLASQQFRQAKAPSDKLNYFLPSLAYANSAGKIFNNEVVQDVSKNVGNVKLNHPLQVLQSEYAAHLCTDKPLYQPGEEVFFRGIALEKASFALPREELHFVFKLIGPDDKVQYQSAHKAQLVTTGTQQPIRDLQGRTMQGVGDGSWKLPANMPLGESTLILSEKDNRFQPQIVKFMVNAISPPRFDKQLQFTRPSYAPGDPVVLDGKIKLPSQQPWANGLIKCQIQIDGEKYDVQGNKSEADITTSTDATGTVKLAFQLPPKISKGQGTLAMQFLGQDGGETWTQPLRIEIGDLQVECYPEGGDLIAGVANTVYFQMRNQSGEATDGEAEVINQKNEVIKSFSTFHDKTEARASRGMGKFSFIPQLNEVYRVRMKKPATSQIVATLPAARSSGVNLHIEQAVLQADAPVLLQLSNMGQPRELVVSVHCREALIALDRFSMPASVTQSIILDNVQPLGGIYRVTVSDYTSQEGRGVFVPMAERLIYRQPSRVLNLNLKAYRSPSRGTQLQIEARTEKQEATGAYCTIVGVNKSLLQLAEATTTRRLPAHFLIAREVRQPEELEFADFLLSEHPSALEALDLLLGVQGWRRFKAPLDMSQTTVDKLPLQCFENRQEVLNQVQEQVKEAARLAPESKLLDQALTDLKNHEAEYQVQARRQSEAQAKLQQQVQQTESLLTTRQAEWQQFSVWFHLLSAGALGLMSLAGLVAMCIKRAFLPMHLICTVGCISVLGLLGAGYLWTRQMEQPAQQQMKLETGAPADTQPVPVPATKQAATGKLEEPRAAENQKSLAPGAALARGASGIGDTRSHVKDTPTESNNKPGTQLTTPPPGKTMALGMSTDAGKPPTKRPSGPDPSVTVPPVGDKLRLNGNSVSPPSYKDKETKPASSNDAYSPTRRGMNEQRNTRLADNRVAQPGTQTADAEKNKSQAVPSPASDLEMRKKTTEARPSTAPAGGSSGAASLGSGGGGGGTGALAPATPKTTFGTGTPKKDGFDTMRDELQTAEAFYLREYSWSPASQPANLKSPAAWSQTVYWHPLQVIPSSGTLTLPLELPPTEGVYQVEVFGHDGQGRLGAGTIEINSPAMAQRQLPVSLQTSLSTRQAKIGDVVQLECIVQNLTSRRQPQIIAKVMLPEGLKLPDNLKQLRQAAKGSTAGDYVEPTRWYIQGRELTLIWPEMATEKKVRMSIDLVCNKSGQFQAAESRAYFENQERDAAHAEGLQIGIKP